MGAYLEADLIIRLFGISFCSISCGYCRSINSTILGNDESMASIVQLQPVEDGATCDDWTCQAGKPMQVGRQQLSNRILQKWIICISRCINNVDVVGHGWTKSIQGVQDEGLMFIFYLLSVAKIYKSSKVTSSILDTL